MASPVADAFDFFPINIASGPEFLLVYLVICVLALAVGKLVATLVASSLDRASVPTKAAGWPKPSRFGLPSVAYHERFTIGFLPHPDELVGVGYLKSGLQGIVHASIGEAAATGWLRAVPGGHVVAPPPEHASPASRDFHVSLLRNGYSVSPSQIRAGALATAQNIEESVKKELRAAGLLRSATTLSTARLVGLAFAGGALLLGLIRAVRGVELGRPIILLVLEMALVAYVGRKVSRPSLRTELGDRYVAWLDAATGSLRLDVQTGRAQTQSDVMLAAALVGASVIPGFGSLAIVSSPTAVWGSSSGDSSLGSGSSCGGSGCGSSGGGGGGCGG